MISSGVGLPDEGPRLLVVLRGEAVDGGLEIDDGVEDAVFQAAAREFGEEALDGVEPGARCWHEMEGPSWVSGQPGEDLGLLVGGVVVENDVGGLGGREFGLDCVEEADELLVPVALHVAPDDRAIKHVERGKQGGGAVALVVVRHRAATARLQGQPRQGAVKRLDLAFLVDRQNDGMGGWGDVEPNHVVQLFGEGLVIGQLEATPAMWRKTVVVPDLHNRRRRDADRFGHCTDGPVRRFVIGRLQRQRHDLVDHPRLQRRNARRPSLVAQQAIDTFGHETLLPAPYTGLGFGRHRHDRHDAQTIGGQQDDPRTPDMLLGRTSR